MSRARVKQSVAGLGTVLIFAFLILISGPDQETVSGQPAEKPKPRPAGQAIPFPVNLTGLTIAFGLTDQKATDWSGDINVSPGKVVTIDIQQGAAKGKVDGNRFDVRTTVAKKDTKKAKKKAEANRPVLRVTLDAPRDAKVEIKTKQGNIAFALGDLEIGSAKKFLNDQISVILEQGALKLTDEVTEDDYPALARAPDGGVWLVYNEYQTSKPYVLERVLAGNFEELIPKGNGDQVRMKKFDGRTWSPTIDVTDTGLMIWRPTVAVDGKGTVHIAWSQRVDDNWDIHYRTYNPKTSQLSKITRVTNEPGSDYHVVAATDSTGNVWLAWQGWRNGRFQIHAAWLRDGGKLAGVYELTKADANHWSPSIACDSKGGVFVAYDHYANANYDVSVQVLGKGKTKTIDIAKSARFEARPVLACDKQDRLWIAYEEGDEQWGKDFATNQFRNIGLNENPGFDLYNYRTIKLKCWDGGKLQQPATEFNEAVKDKTTRGKSHARIAFDAAGGLWLMYRHHPLALGGGEVWNSYATRYSGNAWSSPSKLSASTNLLDNRPGLAPIANGVVTVYSGDYRVNNANRQQTDLFASILQASGETKPLALVADRPITKAELKDVHPNEKEHVARIRDYRIENEGKKLHLYRGEFHRHTEYTAHRDQDGSLEDAFRYGLDAASMDWIGSGDHDSGSGHEYCWWQIQKTTDLLNHAPTFIGALTYERSLPYPNGHRNVIWPKLGIRPLPRGNAVGTEETGTPDTKLLYRYLHHFGAMCSSHTSGTGMGTDWRDNDPVVEPVVEIYQGHRHNYEHYGAPRSATRDTHIGGYEPRGLVWNAFDKGYKLGFQASSDHISTHMSYGVVLTADRSRKGIIDAFKRRHSYAATDNIILDIRSGKHIMGDIFETKNPPSIDVTILGTSPVAKVSIVRHTQYVHVATPKTPDVTFTYTDREARPGETKLYYVRVEQTDGNLAWSSPMWITYRP